MKEAILRFIFTFIGMFAYFSAVALLASVDWRIAVGVILIAIARIIEIGLRFEEN